MGNWKSVCQKNITLVILTSLCWAVNLLNFYFWKLRYPFNPVTELLTVVRQQRKIGTGPVPVRSPRTRIKQSTSKQKHFAREFCEIGVSVHNVIQETPPGCKPFQIKRGPWCWVNTVKFPEPIFTAWVTLYLRKQNSCSPCLSSPRILHTTSNTLFCFIWSV